MKDAVRNTRFSHIIEKNWGVQLANTGYPTEVALAFSPARSPALQLMTGETENISDAAIKITAIHQQRITVVRLL
jgi:hypothetical protein